VQQVLRSITLYIGSAATRWVAAAHSFALLAQAESRTVNAFAPFSTNDPLATPATKDDHHQRGTADTIAPAANHSTPFFDSTTANNHATLCFLLANVSGCSTFRNECLKAINYPVENN
jgi:hypothetical protein